MKKAPAPTKAQGAFKNTEIHFLTIRHIVKAVIVNAALLGWLPYGAADWLVQHGGLTHV